jgi:N-methylhydantoinase A/oxoprolinase/acetone carboxylase beta subunit
MSLRVGIDIGGAFTDLYATDTETKKVEWTKVESTPPEFEKGVLEGIDTLEEQGVYIKNADRILHGQTVVINTIITRTGANVGFITTKNYDIMDIQRANRRDIFNFRYKKPTPLISRYMSEWIDERIDQDGSIHKPLKGKEVASATKALIDKGAESFCIGFINSYQNPQHEKEAKEIDQTARNYIIEEGYGEYFPHLTGHGLGLSEHELPIIDKDSKAKLKLGMVLTIEPGIYIKGIGGARIEDMVLVTREGHEVLTNSTRELVY